MLLAQWWARGNAVTIERMNVRRGGRWRYVEHAPDGAQGFEGRFREVTKPERLISTFEWDNMPGHVVVSTTTLEDLGDGKTKLTALSQFHTPEERDGMLSSGMPQGAAQSYAALDAVLQNMDAQPVPPPLPPVWKVAFTMYPVVDVARARQFYEETLGLPLGKIGGQGAQMWVEYDLPGGGCLAITNATPTKPSADAGGTIALEVEDLRRLMNHLKGEGVEFKSEVIRGPRCSMAVCLDPEGNSILLHQLDLPDETTA